MNRPQPNEYAVFYQKYIDVVDDDVLSELEIQSSAFPAFIRSIPAGKADHAYADGKWTVKELIGHIIDTERIIAYRALRIARNDKTPLAGFEENDYVLNSHYHDRTLESMANEFEAVRRSTLFLFSSFSSGELERRGTANESVFSTKAFLFIAAGHLNHHRYILTERYLT